MDLEARDLLFLERLGVERLDAERLETMEALAAAWGELKAHALIGLPLTLDALGAWLPFLTPPLSVAQDGGWLLALDAARAELRPGVAARALLPTVAAFWQAFAESARGRTGERVVPLLLVNYLWLSGGRPPLSFAGVIPNEAADLRARERCLALGLREAIGCACGGVMLRTPSGGAFDALTDDYRCAQCGRGLQVQWHELVPFL